jgi:hypothetical protein
MNKIKVAGSLIFILLVILAILSNSIAKQNRANIISLERIIHQKAFTQEIAKSIFYLYQKRDSSSKTIENSISKFLNKDKNILVYNKKITKLWNRFYAKVAQFRKQQILLTPYSSIASDRLVNDIYNINIELIVAFDKLLETKEFEYHQSIKNSKKIQRVLFISLLLLLIYLFTQVREIISFIHKFSKTSNTIIQNSTIKGVKLFEIKTKEIELKEITKNYNHLVEQINISIEHSGKSINITTKSLEELEHNIENFMELLAIMEDKQSDEVFKKEDVVIELLEKLGSLNETLKQLKSELEGLLK